MPTSPRGDLAVLASTCRRILLRHRHAAAAVAAGLAMLAGLRVLAPSPPPSALALVAAHDLAAGTRLEPEDLRTVRVARSLLPEPGTMTEAAAIGRVVAAPMRSGEVVTDWAVVGPSALAGYGDGTVATALRLPDPDIASLLAAGDRIDVYSPVAEIGQPAALIAADLTVITVPESTADTRLPGALVLLATTSDQAARLAGAAATGPLTVSIRP